jgi:YD repeat-containing protein
MTSKTDIKGRITYYEYDNFNRLKTIKDNQGNILKQYEYHCKNQKK